MWRKTFHYSVTGVCSAHQHLNANKTSSSQCVRATGLRLGRAHATPAQQGQVTACKLMPPGTANRLTDLSERCFRRVGRLATSRVPQ